MRTSTITATFSSDVQKVWNIVTDNKNYSWRSDLSKIEIANPVMRVLSYLFMNLKDMQKTYVADLRKVLGE